MDFAHAKSVIRMGTAMREITPPEHVALAGFGHRSPPNEGVCRPLYVRAWVFHTTSDDEDKHSDGRALFVQADIIWWGADRLGPLREKLSVDWSIDPEMIMFHASHTHGGPQTSEQFSEVIGRMDAPYMDVLEHQVKLAVAEAHDHLETVTMEFGKGECDGISINRRKPVDDTIQMGPNPDGIIDNQVTVIRFVAEDQRVKGIWFHFTCHPTTTSDNLVTSEYCGVAMEQLDEKFGQGVSCFLQGCCGDIRPSLVKDNQFMRGSDCDVQAYGTRLAACVLDILNKPMLSLKPVALEAWSEQAVLAFQRVPSPEELEPNDSDDDVALAWKRLLRSGKGKLQPKVHLGMQLLRLADGLSLLALDGEVVVEYGLLIKRLSQGHTLPLGYSNGMVGYIPTADQIREGGYESDTSFPVFGYPSPFTTEVENSMDRAIRKLLERSRGE